jgi:hypothetical protein
MKISIPVDEPCRCFCFSLLKQQHCCPSQFRMKEGKKHPPVFPPWSILQGLPCKLHSFYFSFAGIKYRKRKEDNLAE